MEDFIDDLLDVLVIKGQLNLRYSSNYYYLDIDNNIFRASDLRTLFKNARNDLCGN